MKIVAKLRAIWGVSTLLSLSILSVQPLKAQVPNPGVPDFIYQTQGQPVVATFFGRKESFALGCVELRKLWGSVPTKVLSATSFGSVI